MKPVTTNKSGETAEYGGRHKRQYYPGSSSFMKRKQAKAARRVGQKSTRD